MTHSYSLARSFTVASLLCATALGQAPAPFGDLDLTLEIPPLSSGSSGTYGRTLATDVDGNFAPDVVLLRDSTPLVYLAPGSWEAHVEVPVDAIDAASLRNGGNTDALYLTTASGLVKAEYDASTSSFTTTTVATGDWNGALFVRRAELNGTGSADLVGVKSDGRTLISLHESASGFGPGAPPFVARGTVTDIVPWDRTGNGTHDIAVCTTVGLELFDANGGQLGLLPVLDAAGLVTVIDDLAAESVAWVLPKDPSLPQTLAVVRPNGSTHAVQLGALQVVGVAAGDATGDGRPDLLLSIQSSHHRLLLLGKPDPADANQTVYALADEGTDYVITPLIAPTGQASTNVSAPLMVDIDGDGDSDFVQAVQSNDQLQINLNSTIDEYLSMPETHLTRADVHPDETKTYGFDVVPTNPPADATRVVMTVWKSAFAGWIVDTEPYDVQIVPVAALGAGEDFLIENVGGSDWGPVFQFRYENDTHLYPALIYIPDIIGSQLGGGAIGPGTLLPKFPTGQGPGSGQG